MDLFKSQLQSIAIWIIGHAAVTVDVKKFCGKGRDRDGIPAVARHCVATLKSDMIGLYVGHPWEITAIYILTLKVVRVGMEEGTNRVRIATMDGEGTPYLHRLRKRGVPWHDPPRCEPSDRPCLSHENGSPFSGDFFSKKKNGVWNCMIW